MSSGLTNISQRHARLHEDSAALFRALDDETTFAYVPFSRFLDDVEAHLRTDLTVGYRLFLRHPSESLRQLAEHVLNEQGAFPQSFDEFARKWRDASESELRSLEFRDEAETLVGQLFKRIRVEERLVSMLSNVA